MAVAELERHWGSSAEGFRGFEPTYEEHWPSTGCTRSEAWEAVRQQARAAKSSQSFVYAHRRLDSVAALALTQYLRDDCEARFVDLSYLENWERASEAAAAALSKGLRRLRSLTLDGNDIGSSQESLEAWCQALEDHPGIQHLSLKSAQIDDLGAQRIAQVIAKQTLLFSLDLSCNDISDAGMASLVEALGENAFLLELDVEGTDSSEDARTMLKHRLDRNKSRYQGQAGVADLLRGLRRARAEGVVADAKFVNSSEQVAHRPSADPRNKGCVTTQAIQETPAAVSDLARGATFFEAPELEDPEKQRTQTANSSPENAAADAVWFDAPDGRNLLQELVLRSEESWRYDAAAQERMQAMRIQLTELQALRLRERERHEEALQRIAREQQEFARAVRPLEDRILQLREALNSDAGESAAAFHRNLQLRLDLRAAQDGLAVACEELAQSRLGVQRLESGLKLRHHETAERVQQLEEELALRQEHLERLEADNERCRRSLHALRFETETERFVPLAVQARLANAARQETDPNTS